MTDADTHGMITHILAFWISFMEITKKKKHLSLFPPVIHHSIGPSLDLLLRRIATRTPGYALYAWT